MIHQQASIVSKNNLLVDGIEVERSRNDKLRTMNKEIDKNITTVK